MAWKTVEREPMEDDGIEMWKPELVGDFRKGEYIDREDDVGLKNDSTIYQFRDHDKKKDWKTWGSAMIDSLMKDIKLGTVVRLEYMGKKQSAKGNMYKVFQLAVWEDDEEDVGGDPSSSSSSSSSSSLNELSFNPELEAGVIVNGIIEDLTADELRVTKKLILEVAESQLKGAKPELRKAVARDVTSRKRIPTE